jgi:ABC-type uncharacterized transport system substrate-binding protein
VATAVTVTTGLVARLDRPGGNLTGVNLATSELNPKRLELLRAAVPGVSRVAVLGCSPGTVKSNTHRALRRLRAVLDDAPGPAMSPAGPALAPARRIDDVDRP